jgi:hypothetical protein
MATDATVGRSDVLRFRFGRHDLHRHEGSVNDPDGVALLDYGVQDTGADGAPWALHVRGLPAGETDDQVALAWTLRGAPHAYRRGDLHAVAVATSPLSEADAAKRVFDAARPLKAAGIAVLGALGVVAGHLRDIVTEPTVKGEVSSRLTERLDEPYLRVCRPCNAIHVYEQPFRLSALQAGLVLEAGTSPPVLRRVERLEPARFEHSGAEAEPRFDVVRNYLRFFGPARPKDVATFLDAPVKEVTAHWPNDVVEVMVGGDPTGGREPRFALAGDVDELAVGGAWGNGPVVRLVGPYDPYLQLRDRELLVADEARRKELWPVLGRPGAVLDGGEVIGTWRPRASGRKLAVRVEPWTRWSRPVGRLVDDEAERLARHRGVTFAGLERG